MDELLVQQQLARLEAIPEVVAAYAMLQEKLPQGLFYHTFEHTRDVMHEAILFALHDNLTERDQTLLAIAVAYHDTGFVQSRSANESIGGDFALEKMRQNSEWRQEECALVVQMINDTKVIVHDGAFRQIPTTKLSQYLVDADVSNLGREDFFDKAELVRKELGVASATGFYSGVKRLLAGHQWYSPAAIALRSQQKIRNGELLKQQYP
jgi:hypothetical protein